MADLPPRYNVSTLLDANLAAGRADRTAFADDRQCLSHGQLLARACAFGRALRALGVRRDERVLLVLDDSPAFPVAFWGAVRLGAVPAPVNPLLRPDDLRHFAEDLNARAVVADPPHLDRLAAALAGLPDPPLLIVNGAPTAAAPRALPLADLLAEHDGALDPAPTHRDDLAFLLHSGGSTGRPKMIAHLHHDIPATCEAYARHVLALTDEDTVFARLLFHSYGFGAGVSFPAWAGATTVVRAGRPSPQGVLDTLAQERPSLVFLVPTLYNAVVHHPAAAGRDLSFVRRFVSAAEPLAPEVWHRWKDAFGHEILDGIGSTEVLHIFCSNRAGGVRPGSAGQPVPGYQLRLLDDDGSDCPDGIVGHLVVRGDSVSPWYWHEHEKSRRTMQGEWIRTGDRFRRDADGYYWYEGRADDAIKVRGEWVSPIAIEQVLAEHPAVAEAAVVGVPVDGIVTIKAAVVLRAGYEPSPDLAADLQHWCKGRLQRYQFPSVVDFVPELPKTTTGKIQRYRLRQVEA